jgi:hypothetical protein
MKLEDCKEKMKVKIIGMSNYRGMEGMIIKIAKHLPYPVLVEISLREPFHASDLRTIKPKKGDKKCGGCIREQKKH